MNIAKFLLRIPAVTVALVLVCINGRALEPQEDGLFAVMETSKGRLVFRLEFEKTPLTVANFVGLAEGTKHFAVQGEPIEQRGKPFYDGLTFYRVHPGSHVLAGDPQGNGKGGPGYGFQNEIHPTLRHDRLGILSMSNGGPDSKGRILNGSRFLITLAAKPVFDTRMPVFGHLIEGQDVLLGIRAGDRIQSIKILRRGDKALNFKTDQAAFEEYARAQRNSVVVLANEPPRHNTGAGKVVLPYDGLLEAQWHEYQARRAAAREHKPPPGVAPRPIPSDPQLETRWAIYQAKRREAAPDRDLPGFPK